MGRLQAEGQPDYSTVDGEQMATHVVMVENRMIMTMDPAELAAANGGGKTDAEPVDLGAKKRSEEHTSELQSLMRISYAVFCLKKKKQKHNRKTTTPRNT